MTTKKQIAANRKNSARSTGPGSTAGKSAASQNATRHGILSTRLFLPDEDHQAFQQLFDELTASFQPIGVLEMILVEKIAIIIWKQRRVVAAETASTILHSQESHLLWSVNSAMKKHYPDEVTMNSLKPQDPDHVEWSKEVISEWNLLEQKENQEITFNDLKSIAPATWKELQDEAQDENITVEEYLRSRGTKLNNWLFERKYLALSILEKHQLQIKAAELYKVAAVESSILPDRIRASFERYQATLDNQFYRAIKELRMLQDRRLSMIETVPITEPAIISE